MAGTIAVSVILKRSMISRYCFKSNRRMRYIECRSRNGHPMTSGSAKAWNAGRHNNRETCNVLESLPCNRSKGVYIIRFATAFYCPYLRDGVIVGDHGGFWEAGGSAGKA